MGITNKQSVFIDEYLVDLNATQAALRAGYSPKTARQIGSRLLSNVDIRAEIKLRLDERAMPAQEVLKRLSEHARGDLGEFLDIESMSFMVALAEAKEKGITHLIKKVKERTVMTSNKDGEETETHTFELELYDAQAALVHLGRYHKLFTDNTDITSGGEKIKVIGVGVNLDDL